VPMAAIAEVPARGGMAWKVGDAWVVYGDGTVSLDVPATQATAFVSGGPVKLSTSGSGVSVAAGSGGGVVVLRR